MDRCRLQKVKVIIPNQIVSLSPPSQHNLIVGAEAGDVTAHSLVHVVAGDVNDNAPVFIDPMPVLTVIEEDDRDLPLPLATVSIVFRYSISNNNFPGNLKVFLPLS